MCRLCVETRPSLQHARGNRLEPGQSICLAPCGRRPGPSRGRGGGSASATSATSCPSQQSSKRIGCRASSRSGGGATSGGGLAAGSVFFPRRRPRQREDLLLGLGEGEEGEERGVGLNRDGMDGMRRDSSSCACVGWYKLTQGAALRASCSRHLPIYKVSA